MIEQVLAGRRIEGFQIAEYAHCWISTDGGYVISCGALLRYVGNDGTFFTNQDHGHQFGLPSPVDCQSEIENRIRNQIIASVEVMSDTGDLTLYLKNGQIQLICTAGGYENWYLESQDRALFILDRSLRRTN